ncbi:shikimate dehydrogenase [Pseudooceanicola sediminis]|uniref:Shikimate dehydrogenase (NADP(+)) n=1 Tax=Pseudooceanicola sediminis TaxID=2211117 RepID=A0A399IYS7_9RHOB|nr:shikimate dehydrogenase [Pseudooceanicola sediminis]KAA2316039.1 shikimate dehydrogenase [Puniceibacterium sp. HSS470]RII38150.1 shikimate dehydrogenase [Pseudooceanicola sediminis]|tara:strand:- start:20242 stop:21117 length:876 start_codon:yes stop_codon:yes gene_type:complete
MAIATHKDPLDEGLRKIRVGLLGKGIAASRTPGMHMASARALGVPYQYDFLDPLEMTLPDKVDQILDQVEAQGYDGLNVTYPFKQAVIPHVDDLSKAARAVGAINTIVFRDGRRYGHNTDYWGFGTSLRLGLPDAVLTRVILLGAGGAGGAVAQALLDAGVGTLLVHDPEVAKAQELVAILQARFGAARAAVAEDVAMAREVDGIVNASPVGMTKLPGCPLPKTLLSARQWVADIVYFPPETELLAAARALGCAVLPGTGMALYQAVRAFELFSGRAPDLDEMKAVLLASD